MGKQKISPLHPITTPMQLSDASKIMKEIEQSAKELKFVSTNISYDIISVVWNADLLFKKGVYVCGASGIGKTITFLALEKWQRMIGQAAPILNINVREIEDRYKEDGEVFMKEMSEYPRIAFHNFGYENQFVPDYGSKRNVMLDILDRRYDRFQRGNYSRTYITSNYKNTKVHKMGKVIGRRIAEMMQYYEIK